MPEPKQNPYNMSQIWRLFSVSRKERLILRTFSLNSALVVFSSETADRRPLTTFILDPGTVIRLIKVCQDTVNAAPGTRNSLVQMRWDKDAKKYIISSTLIIGKNESNLFYIEMSGGTITSPITFMFEHPGNLEINGTAMTDAEKSKTALLQFIRILDKYLPTAELLSTYNLEYKQQNTNQRKSPDEPSTVVDDIF